MLVALWIVNGLVALMMLAAGGMKLLTPKTALAEKGMAWTEDLSTGAVKAIGAAEAVGAFTERCPNRGPCPESRTNRTDRPARRDRIRRTGPGARDDPAREPQPMSRTT